MYVDEPTNWSFLDQFNTRSVSLLNLPREIDVLGGLSNLKTIEIKGEAFEAWVETYNEIEKNSAKGEELYLIQAAASKAADNIARLAAVQRVFEGGPTAEITAGDIENASEIVLWHLSEAIRLKVNNRQSPAQIVEDWLVSNGGYGKRVKLMQSGPRPRLNAAEVDCVISELQSLNRAKLLDGTIYVHPSILETNNEHIR